MQISHIARELASCLCGAGQKTKGPHTPQTPPHTAPLLQVGYGDVTVASSLGRFWVCCLICLSFIWLPYEVNRLTEMLHLRSRFLTAFTPRADKCVRVCVHACLRLGGKGAEGGISIYMCFAMLLFISPLVHWSAPFNRPHHHHTLPHSTNHPTNHNQLPAPPPPTGPTSSSWVIWRPPSSAPS
jgi:hypothetical protein